jgi:phytoene dehydrogenase-like protein
MSTRFDVIVVGGGHNGLTAAGMLAQAGRRVVVLEGRDALGGLAASEEFHPGYRSAGLLHDTRGVRERIVLNLGLQGHGLRLRPAPAPVLALGDGEPLRLGDDGVKGVSPDDAEALARFREFCRRVRGALQPFLDEPPVDLLDVEATGAWELFRRALRLRSLGSQDMMEVLRLPPMCAADWLDEWFESDHLKVALALPALGGTFLGPRSPGGNANLLLRECAAGPGVEGDGPALVGALARCARAHGAEIRTGAPVEGILLRNGVASGVVVAGGEEIEATVVAASCDPKQVFENLLPRGGVSPRAARHVHQVRSRGTTAQVLLALNARPRFTAADGETVEFARTGTDLVAMERAFDAVKYRRFSEVPLLEIHVATARRPDLAPPGHAVLSVLVHYAPYDLESGWNDEQRQVLGDRVVSILSQHVEDLRQSVVAGKVLSPVDIEERYGIHGGHIHHGEHALDQLLIRPTPECAGYATPVEGLFLCGSGSHPGGGLTCAPGALAAGVILEAS